MGQRIDKKVVFIVEEDTMYQKNIAYVLKMKPSYEIHIFKTGKECLDNLHLKPSIITLDYSLPDMSGEKVLERILVFDRNIKVIILSGQKDVSTAVNLLKQGAYDYITKNKDTTSVLINTLNNITETVLSNNKTEATKANQFSSSSFEKMIIGDSPAMQKVFNILQKAVQSDITVSIYGETGTGKEVVAKAIHQNSNRKSNPFVAVNMSAIPENLIESELFGYEKGAFTGAVSQKIGKFEQANGGILFLDEVADTPIEMQAKLLRVLQERELQRLGGLKNISFDARVIIATHKNLAEEVLEGNFREDLYYRLLGLSLTLPPLKDRGDDIILLAESFLKEFCKKNNTEILSFSEAAKRKLLEYDYPGNVRELRSTVDLATVLCSEKTIEEKDIKFQSVRKETNFLNSEMTLEAYKNKIISHFLEKYDNDVPLVAEKLNIGKSTIYRMLKTGTGQGQS